MSRVLILHSLPKEDFVDRAKRLQFCFRLASEIRKRSGEQYVRGSELICLYSGGEIQTFPEEMNLTALGKLIAGQHFTSIEIESMKADETLKKILGYLPRDSDSIVAGPACQLSPVKVTV